jgi:NTP pyrophosphatase (non-canonical NTP hydrolase)
MLWRCRLGAFIPRPPAWLERPAPRDDLRGVHEPSPDDRLRTLTHAILHFRDQRDWKQFHTPKDQALSLVLEAAELLEIFQWKNGDELDRHLESNRAALEDELADVLGWLLLISADQGIDLAAAFEKKLAKNCAKYPVERVRGSAKKYDQYR